VTLKGVIVSGGVAVALGSSTVLAQNVQPESPAAAVGRCIGVVHNTHLPEQFMESFFKNFDAYYNPSTGMVYDNAQSVGDMKARFVFRKCMTEQGFPLGDK
jgi:hypothetical protein